MLHNTYFLLYFSDTMFIYSLYLLLLFSAVTIGVGLPIHSPALAQCFFGFFERPLPGLAGVCIDTLLNTRFPLSIYISVAVTVLIVLIVALGIVSIAVGGYFYMTAGGSADRVQLGKTIIVAALIGITLALASWVILYTISPQFLSPSL